MRRMTDITPPLPMPEAPRRFRIDLALPALFRPRRVFPAIAEHPSDTWLTPILLMTLTALLAVLVAGPLRREAVLNTPPVLPPDFQYYTPEQQAQILQAQQATAGTTFTHLFPALGALARVWAGWLITGALLHLTTTLLGGRATMRSMMNRVAWAGLPFALRDVVRSLYMWGSHRLIASPGLSGLVASGDAPFATASAALLALIDVYFVWHVLLLVIAVRSGTDPGPRKAWASVLLTEVVLLMMQVVPSVVIGRLSSLTIIRPFLF